MGRPQRGDIDQRRIGPRPCTPYQRAMPTQASRPAKACQPDTGADGGFRPRIALGDGREGGIVEHRAGIALGMVQQAVKDRVALLSSFGFPLRLWKSGQESRKGLPAPKAASSPAPGDCATPPQAPRQAARCGASGEHRGLRSSEKAMHHAAWMYQLR